MAGRGRVRLTSDLIWFYGVELWFVTQAIKRPVRYKTPGLVGRSLVGQADLLHRMFWEYLRVLWEGLPRRDRGAPLDPLACIPQRGHRWAALLALLALLNLLDPKIDLEERVEERLGLKAFRTATEERPPPKPVIALITPKVITPTAGPNAA